MAKRKQPDYAKEPKEASTAFTEMKIKKGRLHGGFYLGSGDRAESIARLRRWVEIAAEHLSTEGIDHVCFKIPLGLNAESMDRGDEPCGWLGQWRTELAEDKRARAQVQ
jgi:hypothetical protein